MFSKNIDKIVPSLPLNTLYLLVIAIAFESNTHHRRSYVQARSTVTVTVTGLVSTSL
jgi:hypothetical protein